MTQNGCEIALGIVVNRLRIACRKAGLNSVRDVARASGVSKSGIDRIWKYEHFPTLDTLLAICSAADIYLQDVLHDHENWRLQQEQEGTTEQPEKASEPVQPEQAAPPQPEKASEPVQPEKAEQPEPVQPERIETESRSILDILKGMAPTE